MFAGVPVVSQVKKLFAFQFMTDCSAKGDQNGHIDKIVEMSTWLVVNVSDVHNHNTGS